MALSTGAAVVTRFTLILLILTSITLFTLDFRGFAPLNSARSAVLDRVRTGRQLRQRHAVARRRRLERRVRLRRRQERERSAAPAVDELEGQITSGDVAKQSLQQLLEQVDIPFVGDIPTVGARVSCRARSPTSTTPIEIDKGENAGIKTDMPVVTGRGLIGRVDHDVVRPFRRRVVEQRRVLRRLQRRCGTNVLGEARGPRRRRAADRDHRRRDASCCPGRSW